MTETVRVALFMEYLLGMIAVRNRNCQAVDRRLQGVCGSVPVSWEAVHSHSTGDAAVDR